MAPIQKDFTLADGRVGNYYVIDGVYLPTDSSSTRAFFRLYTNQASFVSGDAPIHRGEVILTNEQNPIGMGKLIDLVQQKLITIPGNFLSGTIV